MWEANSEPQSMVLESMHHEILAGGARGGGKTDVGIVWNAEPEYIGHPEYRSLVIRQDFDDLSDWIFRAKRMYQGIGEVRETKPPLIRWNGGGETRLGHWKDRDTISKYIGHEYWKMLFEESTQSIKSEHEFKMITGSCRCSAPGIVAQKLLTCNPGGAGHSWHKKYFVDKGRLKTYVDPETGLSRIYIPFGAKDNPNIDPTYVKWLDGLPEPLRSAWRDGSWDVYEGQFFVNFGEVEEPFEIPTSDMQGNLFAGLDGGTTHPTAFGIYWHAPRTSYWRDRFGMDDSIHLLFTYKGEGGTMRGHAEAILEKLEAFPWTKGLMPDKIFYDGSMDTKVKLNEYSVKAPIDEFKEVWARSDRRSQWVAANKNKHNGCQICRILFEPKNGVAQFKYWAGFNRDYVDGMMSVVTDPNDQEIYQKQDGDDICDSCRYALIGIWTEIGNAAQKDKSANKFTAYNKAFAKKNWRDI